MSLNPPFDIGVFVVAKVIGMAENNSSKCLVLHHPDDSSLVTPGEQLANVAQRDADFGRLVEGGMMTHPG